MWVVLVVGATNVSYAAETVCNDNGGAGWPIVDGVTSGAGGITNLSIPFNFGDVSVIHDVNVTTDITHTWIGDLTAKITSPDTGTQITLFERPGTTAPDSAPGSVGPWGCNQNDIVVTFDDEAASGTNIENLCPPVANGTYLPHNPAPNNLSIFDGEDPSGNWIFYLSDSAEGDQGTLNQACITASFAAVSFDKWVSTNNTCSDTLDTLTVTPGTDVYYCYTASNPGTETFTINPGAAFDDQGHDISALETTYAPDASQTVVVGPITAGSATLPDNTTTTNNAQVTATFATANFTGDLVTSESASLTVSISPPSPPADGVKRLYFDNVDDPPGNLTRDPTDNITRKTSGDIAKDGGTLTLNQGIKFATPFTIKSDDTDIVAVLRIRRMDNRDTSVQVEVRNGNTNTLIGTSSSLPITENPNRWHTVSLPISLASDVNLDIDDYIQVIVRNTSTGNRSRDIQIRTEENGNIEKSHLQVDTNTVINVDSIEVFNAANGLKFSSYKAGTQILIRAIVSDPFGSDDITGANITITDPTGSPPVPPVTNVAMTSVSTTAGTRTYEYTYDIPPDPAPDGFWNISVTADEGYEGEISHTSQSTMIVGSPNLTISKNSNVFFDPVNTSNYKSIPGAIVEYTITVDNSGYGYVDLNTFVLDDALPAGTTFFFGSPLKPIDFTDGVPPSGLTFTFIDLASTVDDVEFYNNSGTNLVTPTVDGNGNDTTVPPIDLIKIIPKGEFNGGDTTPANNPSMEFKFRVKVD